MITSEEQPKANETPPEIPPPQVHQSAEKQRHDPQKGGIPNLKILLPQRMANIKIPIPPRSEQMGSDADVPFFLRKMPKPPQPPQTPLLENAPILPEKSAPKKEEPPQDNIFDPECFHPQKFEVQIPRVTEKNRASLTKLNTSRPDALNHESAKHEKQPVSDILDIHGISPQKNMSRAEAAMQTILQKGKNQKHTKKVLLNPPPSSLSANQLPHNAPPATPNTVQAPSLMSQAQTATTNVQTPTESAPTITTTTTIPSANPTIITTASPTIMSTTTAATTTTITHITQTANKPIITINTVPTAIIQANTQLPIKNQSVSFLKEVKYPPSLLNAQGTTPKVTFSAANGTPVTIPISGTQLANISFLKTKIEDKKLPVKPIPNQSIPPTPQPISLQPQPQQQLPTTLKSSAPNPLLPSSAEVQVLINEVTDEIDKLKDQIADMKIELSLSLINVPPLADIKTEFAIQNYHGFLMPQHQTEEFKKKNAELIAKSHSKHTLESTTVVSHISQLPNYLEELQSEQSLSQPMMRVVMQSKILLREKKCQLAHDYKQIYIPWQMSNTQLTAYYNEAHECIDIWPPEFAANKRKTLDRSILLPLCAPDQPMLIEESEKVSSLYYNENNFVLDPLAEHIKYKKRTTWTEVEKRIFLEKYVQHPHEFKKIAAGLPSKTVKDVIEFYYINRVKLNLKGIENNTRTRGRKRVITEGPMK